MEKKVLFLSPNLTHGNNVFMLCDDTSCNPLRDGWCKNHVKPKLECDSIIIPEKNPLAQKLILLTPAGDCPPILMAANNGQQRAIAVAHAGWRSSLNQVTVNTVKRLLDLGYQKNEIKILIGPGIDSCCFQVSFEVAEQFIKENKHIYRYDHRGKRHYLDLQEFNRDLLKTQGIPARNISVMHECTYCTKEKGQYKYPSHRRGNQQRFIAAITLAAD